MKVGDYVRTKDYQNIRSRIGKIIKQDGKYYYLDIDENTQIVWEEDTILKSRPNPIDLIEVGDIITYKTDIGTIRVQDVHNSVVMAMIKSGEIEVLSIVTKEQFSQMEYKL